MSIAYPLFVLLDDRNMLVVESPDRILYHLEAIDTENEEYLFWDATGKQMEVKVLENRVSSILPCKPCLSLREAFASYLKTIGLPVALSEGPPMDAWTRIQEELRKHPKKSSWFTKLFAR
jgi:hypothetical protein